MAEPELVAEGATHALELQVNGMEGSWSVHPDAEDLRVEPPPVRRPGSVVGLGAICDLRSQQPNQPFSQSFSVSEFVTLDDGRRVILHEDRGFTIGWGDQRLLVALRMYPRASLAKASPRAC
jgi:hypothetical protein